MLVKKIIPGYVEQVYDIDRNVFVQQQFIPTEKGAWEDNLKYPPGNPSLRTNMKQPANFEAAF